MVSSFGDGAINTGGCHEGLNVAAVHKVPAVFVCENNKIALSTPFDRVPPVASITDRASAYGMAGKSVDGTDAVAMLEGLKECVRQAGLGKGPPWPDESYANAFQEAKLLRLGDLFNRLNNPA